MVGNASEPRYALEPVPLARRIRNAIVAVGGFGGAAAVTAAYQAAHASLSEHWFYPVGVAAFGVICAALALMEKAWPEPPKDGKDGTFGSPTRS